MHLFPNGRIELGASQEDAFIRSAAKKACGEYELPEPSKNRSILFPDEVVTAIGVMATYLSDKRSGAHAKIVLETIGDEIYFPFRAHANAALVNFHY